MITRCLVGVAIAALLAMGHAPAPSREAIDPVPARLPVLERRVALLAARAPEAERVYWRDIYPIESGLLRSGRVRDERTARVAAWAIVREAEKRHLSPALVAAVVGQENPWLIPDTTSSAGAVGWMQVMPFHQDDGSPHLRACGPGDLADGELNVCYGADIFRQKIGLALDRALRDALNWYSGCVNTPGCESYAEAVVRRTNQQ